MNVIGIDGTKAGWVGICLKEGAFAEAFKPLEPPEWFRRSDGWTGRWFGKRGGAAMPGVAHNSVVKPKQIDVSPVISQTGGGYTVKLALQVVTQVLASVTVTWY